MAEQDEKQGDDKAEGIDYSDDAAKIDKAKQKARDADAERLRQEHE